MKQWMRMIGENFVAAMGKLLHVASERPDCQYVVQGLASFMQKLTKEA